MQIRSAVHRTTATQAGRRATAARCSITTSCSELSRTLLSTSSTHSGKQCQQEMQSPLEPATRSIPSPAPAPLTQEQQAQEDVRFMRLALDQGHLGAAAGEVPVGAVLVHDGAVIASAHNLTHSTHSPLAHAEMLCISRAAEHMQAWRLLQATLYVTIEPCPMCAGAILQSRLKRVVYGAPQPRMGCDGSWLSMFPSQDGRQGVGSHHSPQTKSELNEVEGSSRDTNADLAAQSPESQPPLSDQVDEISLATTSNDTQIGQRSSGNAQPQTSCEESRPGVGSDDAQSQESPGCQSPGQTSQGKLPYILTGTSLEVAPGQDGTQFSRRVDKKQRNLLSASLQGTPSGPSLRRPRLPPKAKNALLSGQIILPQRGVSPWGQTVVGVAEQKPDRPSGTARGEQRLHPFHPDLKVARGVLGEEAASLMQSFFKQRRVERPHKEVE